MRITVDRDHIARGVPGNPCFCPVALALKKRFPSARVSVNTLHAKIVFKGGPTLYLLHPPRVVGFIMACDRGEAVTPVTFDVNGVSL